MRFAPESAGTRQSVVSGALATLTGQAVVYVLGFLTSILIARAVGAEGRGEYYVPVIAAATCVAVANIGLENANTVFFARRDYTLRQLSRNASFMALVVGPIASGAMVLLFFATSSTVFRSISVEHYLIAIATIPFTLHLLWLANAFLLAKQIARSQLALAVGGVAQFTGTLVLALFDALTVTAVLLFYGASVLCPWLLHILWSRNIASVRPAVDGGMLRRVVAFGLKLHVGLMFSYLLLRFDVFLVNAFLDTSDVGIYSLAVLFAELAWLLANPLVQATIPFQVAESIAGSARLAFKAARFNLALGLLISACFAGTLWLLIPVLYGSEFQRAYPALLLLMPGVTAMAASRPLGVLLSRQERPWLYSAFTIVAFSLNCILNVIFLPLIGIFGASMSSSVAYLGLAIGLVWWALRATSLRPGEAFLPQAGDVETIKRTLARAVEVLPMRHARG